MPSREEVFSRVLGASAAAVIYSIRYLDVHSIYGYPWPFEKDLILFHCTIIPFLPGFWAPGHSSISSCHAMQ